MVQFFYCYYFLTLNLSSPLMPITTHVKFATWCVFCRVASHIDKKKQHNTHALDIVSTKTHNGTRTHKHIHTYLHKNTHIGPTHNAHTHGYTFIEYDVFTLDDIDRRKIRGYRKDKNIDSFAAAISETLTWSCLILFNLTGQSSGICACPRTRGQRKMHKFRHTARQTHTFIIIMEVRRWRRRR